MTRGQLRVYFGAAPGVGKTVAMLAEARRRQERGADVVIGLVETHGRPYTAEMAEGFERIPLRPSDHRGTTLHELDVEAVLARRPDVVLVDELAHTNAPGSRHGKRWEDVEQLLEAGVEVISTVNVQHLESLGDVVESITGVRQQETVPDEVVRAADQIELVDMSPHSLRRRLAHGNVYRAERIDAALANYFREGNLAALRELSLLWLADRVEEGLSRYRTDQGITDSWPTRERVVVALSGGTEGRSLLRRAGQIASRGSGGELLAVHVTPPDGLVGTSLEALGELRRVTTELGGTFHQVSGEDPAEAVLDFARGVNARQIVLGVSRRPRWRAALAPGTTQRVIDGSGEVDVHVVSDRARTAGDPGHPDHPARSGRRTDGGRYADVRGPAPDLSRRRRVTGWLVATVGTALLSLVLSVLDSGDDLPLDVLLFLGLTVAAALTGGIGPALVAAVLASLAINWFFTPPVHTFTIASGSNLVAVVVFVIVALSVSWAVHLSERRARAARLARREAEALAQSAGDLLSEAEQLPALLRQCVEFFGMREAGLVRRDSVREPWQVLGGTTGFVVDDVADASVRAPVDDTTTLVLVGPVVSAADRRLVSAYATRAAALLRREELVEQAGRARTLARDGRARTALLAAVSHDLRTPLAGIKAAVSSLRGEVAFGPEDEAMLLETIETSTDRLTALVSNLLDMSRLQSESVVTHPQPVHLLDAVASAAAGTGEPERVRVRADADLAPMAADPVLLDRVLGNVLENALRHSPGRQEVVVRGGVTGDRVEVRVVDRGVGVAQEGRVTMFEPFQRLGDVRAVDQRGTGVGLGLAVARGLVEAMEGTIAAEDTPGGGLTVVIDLPRPVGSAVGTAGDTSTTAADPGPTPAPGTTASAPDTGPDPTGERMPA